MMHLSATVVRAGLNRRGYADGLQQRMDQRYVFIFENQSDTDWEKAFKQIWCRPFWCAMVYGTCWRAPEKLADLLRIRFKSEETYSAELLENITHLFPLSLINDATQNWFVIIIDEWIHLIPQCASLDTKFRILILIFCAVYSRERCQPDILRLRIWLVFSNKKADHNQHWIILMQFTMLTQRGFAKYIGLLKKSKENAVNITGLEKAQTRRWLSAGRTVRFIIQKLLSRSLRWNKYAELLVAQVRMTRLSRSSIWILTVDCCYHYDFWIFCWSWCLLYCSLPYTACGCFAGMTMDSPPWSSYFTPSMVISPVPSRQVTKASPPDSWVLISSPLSKANKVMLDRFILYQCLLTIWPSLVGNLIF